MTAQNPRRVGTLLGGALLGTSLLLAPTAAFAAPTAPAATTPFVAESVAGECAITDASLKWGVKESFRSYISGSIANGSWEATDGATYDTPDFEWSDGTGTIDPETGTGSISFTGTVSFTGHDGVLDMRLSNPTIEFEGDGQASLLLDAKSNDSSGKLVIDAEQEWVGDITVASQIVSNDGEIELEALPTVLTNTGAKAFAGFYEAGAELDPISLEGDAAGCEATEVVVDDGAEGSAEEGTASEVIVEETTDANQIPWVPIGIGAVALLVIGITGGMLLGGRGKKSANGNSNANSGE